MFSLQKILFGKICFSFIFYSVISFDLYANDVHRLFDKSTVSDSRKKSENSRTDSKIDLDSTIWNPLDYYISNDEKRYSKRKNLISIKKSNSEEKNVRLKIDFDKLLIAKGFPINSIETMRCIAKNESGFNPLAYNYNKNKTFDVGLFQINQIWKQWCRMTDRELLDIENNVKCARIVLEKQGYMAWVTYKKSCSI